MMSYRRTANRPEERDPHGRTPGHSLAFWSLVLSFVVGAALILLVPPLIKYSFAGFKQAPYEPATARLGFCQLVDSPAAYHLKEVRTEAILYIDMENAFLYDPSCKSAAKVDVVFEPSYADVVGEDEAVDHLIRPGNVNTSFSPDGLERRVKLDVVGKFDNSPNQGHLDSYSMGLKIMKIEGARPVPKELPWP